MGFGISLFCHRKNFVQNSSNVATLKTDKPTLSQISCSVNVNIEVEPHSVEHTSPDKFADVANKFITKYTNANEPTEIIAITVSSLIL